MRRRRYTSLGLLPRPAPMRDERAGERILVDLGGMSRALRPLREGERAERTIWVDGREWVVEEDDQ